MARRTVSFPNITCTAFADAGALTNGLYPTVIQGGSGTQRNLIWGVNIGGLAQATGVMIMIMGRDSTVGVTLGATTTFDASNDPATVALTAAPIIGNTWTTPPQRSTTLHLKTWAFNPFGGNAIWQANKVEECYTILGNTASFGEISFSAYTGSTATTAVGGDVVYEPL